MNFSDIVNDNNNGPDNKKKVFLEKLKGNIRVKMLIYTKFM